jgi:hypothetical protein
VKGGGGIMAITSSFCNIGFVILNCGLKVRIKVGIQSKFIFKCFAVNGSSGKMGEGFNNTIRISEPWIVVDPVGSII